MSSVLAGSLKFITLADIFQILGGNNSSGVLSIKSQYTPNPGVIYFSDGNPVNATTGGLKGIDALYALFGWIEGSFEFREEEIHVGKVIKQSRMEIVLDALRMLDDGDIPTVGPVSFDADAVSGKGAAQDKKSGSSVIKGPLVDYSYVLEEETYPDGKEIVKEGTHGKWMWVIFEGTASVSRELETGPITIAMLGEGSFIGTFEALLFGSYTRTATVTAVGDVRLCLLDSERLFETYSSFSSGFKDLLLSMNSRLKGVSDRVVELYSDAEKKPFDVEGKDILIKKGANHEDLLKIVEGEAYIVGHTKKNTFPILKLKKNDVFGHFPFMDMGHEPGGASVLASKDLTTEKLDLNALQQEYDKASATFRNLIFNVATSISATTRLAYHLLEKK